MGVDDFMNVYALFYRLYKTMYTAIVLAILPRYDPDTIMFLFHLN